MSEFDPRLNYEPARASAEEAIRLAPDEPGTHAVLGVVRARAGKSRLAKAAFETALRLDPDNLAYRFNLSQVALETRRTKQATELSVGILRERPDLFHAKRPFLIMVRSYLVALSIWGFATLLVSLVMFTALIPGPTPNCSPGRISPTPHSQTSSHLAPKPSSVPQISSHLAPKPSSVPQISFPSITLPTAPPNICLPEPAVAADPPVHRLAVLLLISLVSLSAISFIYWKRAPGGNGRLMCSSIRENGWVGFVVAGTAVPLAPTAVALFAGRTWSHLGTSGCLLGLIFLVFLNRIEIWSVRFALADPRPPNL